jgi:hypothetical protein
MLVHFLFSPLTMLHLVESVGECLDRESARRLVQLDLKAEVRACLKNLAGIRGGGRLQQDEWLGYVMTVAADEFVKALQKKARAIIRKPVGRRPSSQKTT